MKNIFRIIRKKISEIILYSLMHWKMVNFFPPLDRFIIVLAPHRKGFFEILLGSLVAWITNLSPKHVFIKYEVFRIPIVSSLLKWLGGIPTDRIGNYTNRPKGSYIIDTVQLLNSKPRAFLVITPEGTRISKENSRPEWKHGFYTISKKSGIPMVLVALDYKNKRIVIKPEPIYTSPSNESVLQEDLDKISLWFQEVIPDYVPNINIEKFLNK